MNKKEPATKKKVTTAPKKTGAATGTKKKVVSKTSKKDETVVEAPVEEEKVEELTVEEEKTQEVMDEEKREQLARLNNISLEPIIGKSTIKYNHYEESFTHSDGLLKFEDIDA